MNVRNSRKLFSLVLLFLLISSSFVSAQWNNALHFTWDEHDRVIVPDAASLWPLVLEAGTVEMWFKPDSVLKADTHDPDYTYLFCKNVSGNVEGDMGITWKRGAGDLQCFVQDGTVTQDVYPGIPIWDARWYHIAFVWDTQDSMRVFIDGVQSADIEPNEAEEACLPVYGGVQEIVIGSGSVNLLDSRFETFRGTIDEVRISAISRYNKDFVPSTQPHELDAYTIALWNFDEGTGDVATDLSGNGFTGYLGNPDSVGYADPEWVKVEKDMKLAINEILIDPAADIDTTDNVEGDANGDGVREAQGDEFVEFINITAQPLDLTGWQLGDDERVDFQFPDGYTLQPFEFVTIFGGGDVSNVPGYDVDPSISKVFATGDSVGNGFANSGDYFVLLSPDGNHDMYFAYGSKYEAGAPTADFLSSVTWEFELQTAANGNNNNSLTRYPDINQSVEDPWVEHNTITDVDFSPNQTTDGMNVLEFDINLSVNGNGSISIDPAKEKYSYGDVVTFTATPAEKNVFDKWTLGKEFSTTNPLSVSISGEMNITANFVPQFQITPTLIVNELLADPAADPVNGDANGDGIRDGSQDEFVELTNIGLEPFDLSGFKFGDDEDLSFTFPDGYVVQPGEFVVVFGGGDVTNVPGYSSDILATKVFISDSVGVGNGLANGGDFIVLKSPDGSYDLWAGYNSKYNAGGPTSDVVAGIDFEMRIETAANGKNDNSLTRNPDGNISIGDPFVEHNTVSSKMYSPGTTIDSQFVVGVESISNIIPEAYSLLQNYPNPFNPTTEISFSIPQSGLVKINIYDIRGRKVKSLVKEELNSGIYKSSWDGTNNLGAKVTSGVYLYRIEANDFIQTKKMVMLK